MYGDQQEPAAQKVTERATSTGSENAFVASVAGLNVGLGCEFYGACPRLVITPLTDRAYLTFSQAVLLGLGSAPAGPAGTGKTETVKDLARTLMLPVVVTNCGPQTSTDNVSSVLRTIASNGGWACFDEFNRINASVLSSVAEVLRSLQGILRQHLARPVVSADKQAGAVARLCHHSLAPVAHFGAIESRIQPTASAFITMNPGYAGRVDLPQNVASLFRPCSMVRPDLEAISANLLLSLGFSTAQSLAKRLVRLVYLASRSLVPRQRYDWGLRALKGCLLNAAEIRGNASGDEAELHAIVASVRSTYSPRLDSESGDAEVFDSLIVELFPGIGATIGSSILSQKVDAFAPSTSNSGDADLDGAMVGLGLAASPAFLNGVRQLRQLLNIRHANIILGEPSSGKTSIWRSAVAWAGLARGGDPSMVADIIKRSSSIVLPKSMVGDSLYGRLDSSGDWTDGHLTASLRLQAADLEAEGLSPTSAQEFRKLLVLDGTVDANWIEDLNSVMDDTKTLVLPSRERLELQPGQRILIETASLRNATPATVSRCGIVYVPASAVPW